MDRSRLFIIGGAIVALAVVYMHIKSNATSVNATNPNGPTTLSSSPVQANVTGITDATGNLLPQFQWPYNQLALPYNWSGNNDNGMNYTNPVQGNFIGYQATPAYSPMTMA
jgi:hypothetical protein